MNTKSFRREASESDVEILPAGEESDHEGDASSTKENPNQIVQEKDPIQEPDFSEYYTYGEN